MYSEGRFAERNGPETLKEGDWDMSSLFENLCFANFCPRNSVQHFSCGKFVSTPVSNVL